MDYIECEPVQGIGYCSDNDCPCTVTQIPQDTGYLYISPEVVEFRKDALTQAAVKKKLAPMIEQGESISIMQHEPILICKQGARKRRLDLNVAAEDAKQWWENHTAPLRPTPLASEEAIERSDLDDMEASVREKIQAKPASTIDPSSTQDVVSNFAGTPLAELAAKMADDPEPQPDDDWATTDTAIPSSPYNNEPHRTNDTLAISGPPPSSLKIKKKSKKKSKTPFIIILILIIIGGISFALYRYLDIQSLFDKKIGSFPLTQKPVVQKDKIESLAEITEKEIEEKKEVIRKEEPVQKEKPATPATELTQPFFNSAYTFKDDQYHGTIRFQDVTPQSGIYEQRVSVTGKEKVFQLSGSLKYTPSQITFRPDGSGVDVVWKLQSLNTSGYSAIFYDPQKADKVEARIYLKACKTKDCN